MPPTPGLYNRIAEHIRLVGERSSAALDRFVDESVGVLGVVLASSSA
jgi:hypothetical protein